VALPHSFASSYGPAWFPYLCDLYLLCAPWQPLRTRLSLLQLCMASLESTVETRVRRLGASRE